MFCHRFFGRFRDHPRMCGEHLPESAICGHSRGSSPHVRGAQNLLPIMQDLDGIIPACAGSTVSWRIRRPPCRDHPRMCGEHNRGSSFGQSHKGSSPHVRGARQACDDALQESGIIPACAGSTTVGKTKLLFIWDHPRMCGEHELGDFAAFLDQGSSPHVRGARRRQQDHPGSQGIIPACAGSTSRPPDLHTVPRDHPRMCGEHPLVTSSASPSAGSSPHVRGARFIKSATQDAVGIIPACAGSTVEQLFLTTVIGDHPRMCGEHRTGRPYFAIVQGSSPHVRGALLHLRVDARDRGIIPACAGSTHHESDGADDERDHPRMCGEHRTSWPNCEAKAGSSPHVRGAPKGRSGSKDGTGIIPACAGSTP